MEDREFDNVFSIPANYTDSGKIRGGMLEPRNAIEAVIVLVIGGSRCPGPAGGLSGADVDPNAVNDPHRCYDGNTDSSCCCGNDGN